jgi:hypothetical protein
MTAAAAAALPSTRPERIPGEIARRNSAIRRRIRSATELTHTARDVLGEIAEYCNYGDNARGCFAHLKTIGKHLGISTRQMSRIVKTLFDGAWIEAERQSKTGSKFARMTMHLGPSCWVISMPGAPRHFSRPHLDIQGTAPRQGGLADNPPIPYGDENTEETTTSGAEPSSSSFGETLEATRPPDPNAFDQAMVQDLVTRLVALGLRRSRYDPSPVDRAAAEIMIPRVARFYAGGLRWVAWAIYLASQRTSPTKFWTWLVGTLTNWKSGDGIPPDGWPPDQAAPIPASSKPGPVEDPPGPRATREELEAAIKGLEAKPRLLPHQQTELAMARDELAALDTTAELGGHRP